MAFIHIPKIISFNKPYALLTLLLCFCFISTSYAQPCLSETEPSYTFSAQLELEDNHEPSEAFTGELYLTKLEQNSKAIAHTPAEDLPLQSLPSCNRDPPLTLPYHKQHSIL